MTRGKLFFASRPFIRLVVGRWSVQAPPPEGPTTAMVSPGATWRDTWWSTSLSSRS